MLAATAAVRAGDNQVAITELAGAAGLNRNTINLVVRRTTEPTQAPLQSVTSAPEAIRHVSRTAEQWRELTDQQQADLQLVEGISDLFDKATAVEGQSGGERDQPGLQHDGDLAGHRCPRPLHGPCQIPGSDPPVGLLRLVCPRRPAGPGWLTSTAA
ncbi:hypothetical protein GCM10020219_104760 [Nonomuraea dietziae]